LLWRPLGLPDVRVWAALLAAAEEAERTGELRSADDLAEELTDPAIKPGADTLAGYHGTDLVAYGKLLPRPSAVDAASVMVEGVVHPRMRGRGIGAHLVRWQIERGTHWLGEHYPGLPGELHAQVHESNQGKRELYERHGFAARRWFFQLARDPAADPADLADQADPADPAGLTLVPFAPEYDARTHAAYLAAMAGRLTPFASEEATWRRWFTGTRKFRPGLSFLALSGSGDTATVVGYLLGSDHEAGLAGRDGRVAWGNHFGTRPQWRGRGVGSALIRRFLAAARTAGYGQAMVMVDRANPTGVLSVFERHGFARSQTVIRYVRQI
jgi:mycothiol synthase